MGGELTDGASAVTQAVKDVYNDICPQCREHPPTQDPYQQVPVILP